eukprot:jgi/Mesen1/1363/ME000013S00855
MPVNENPTPAQLASGWGNYVLKNDMFESYYKKLKIMPESDWEEFLAAMRKPLPTTFRINGSGKFACEIRDQMQRDFVDLLKDGIEVDGEKLDPPRPLPWYPSNLAWHMSFSRTQLRKLPILLKVFDFMKRENEIGSITRQEAVSMVPPLLLDVQPHHFVLDMCAAPGSKTFQLLEMIHNGQEPSNLPTGMVVANDVDVQRCHLLIHQTQRMCSPSILVTNHEAQFFPSLKGHPKGGHGGAPGGAASSSPSSSSSLGPDGLMFDRILCDVPCSGDGTLRKAPDIWRKWTVGAGNGLHNLQVRIAMRGVALLKVGGRLIYSTCSLNPVEDEAVVAQVLRESQGAVELVDASHLLPALKRRPGLKSWKIKDKKRWYSSWSQVDEKRAGTLVSSMFPSGRGAAGGGAAGPQAAAGSAAAPAAGASSEAPRDAAAEDDGGSIEVAEGGGLGAAAAAVADEDEGEEGPAEVSNLPLERCMRVLPQDQDTGGFFIAVLQKVAPLVVAEAVAAAAALEPCACRRAGRRAGVDIPKIFIPLSFSHSTHPFPAPPPLPPWPPLILPTAACGRAGAGRCAQERQSMKEGMAPCAFRIAAEGLPILLPHITRQIVECGPRDFKLVLARRSLHFEAFHDLALVKALQDSLMGCLVLALRRPDEDLSKPPKTAVGLWRGKANVSLLVTKVESNQMLERLDLGPDEVEAEGGAEVAPPAEETAAAAAADGDATARDAPGATAVAPAATADALVPSKASGSGDEVNNGHLLEPSVPQQEV